LALANFTGSDVACSWNVFSAHLRFFAFGRIKFIFIEPRLSWLIILTFHPGEK
jgi:hypothetical protein